MIHDIPTNFLIHAPLSLWSTLSNTNDLVGLLRLRYGVQQGMICNAIFIATLDQHYGDDMQCIFIAILDQHCGGICHSYDVMSSLYGPSLKLKGDIKLREYVTLLM